MSTVQQVHTSEDPGPGSSGMMGHADNSSNSRKRSREDDDSGTCCIGGCGNPNCNAKRTNAESSESLVRWWYIKLDSEDENYDSDTPSSLQEESVWSNQDNETEPVKDSDDDFSLSDDDETRWQASHRIEFELASDHSSDEEEGPFSKRRRANDSGSSTTCSSDLEAAAAVVAMVTSEALCDYFADSSSDSSDPELAPQDKWSCLKCKQKNQPIPRYCQHCFAVRKKWFPPRPRHRGQARRRGAARCQAERSQAEARRTSLSFPPPPIKTNNRNTRSPQPGTSRQDFPFVHPSSQPNPTTLTPPCTDSSFSSNSKSSLEENSTQVKSEPVTSSSKIDEGNLVHTTVTLEDIKDTIKNVESSKAESIPDTVILSNSEDSDNDTRGKFVSEFDSFFNDFSKNVDKALQAEKEIKEKNNLQSRSCENMEDQVDSSMKSDKLPDNVSNVDLSIMQCSQDTIDKCSTSISQSFLHKLEGLFAKGNSAVSSQKIEDIDIVTTPSHNCEDVVDGPRKSIQHLEEDVVDFPQKLSQSCTSTQISEDIVDFSQKLTENSEDVIDFPRKPTENSEDVVDFPQKSTENSEDVVDFPRKSTENSEDVVDFPRKLSQNCFVSCTSTQISEDVVDFPRKVSQNCFVPCTSTQISEDVVDYPRKSSANSFFFCRSQQISEDVIDSPRKSSLKCILPCTSTQNSEDVVDFPLRKTTTADMIDFTRKLSQNCRVPCTSTQNCEDVVDFPLKKPIITESTIDFDLGSSINVNTLSHNLESIDELNTLLTNKSENIVHSNSPNLVNKLELVNSVISLKRSLIEDTEGDSTGKIQKIDSQDTSSFTSHCSTSPSSKPPSPTPENSVKLCIVCETKPADTAFTHGRFAHQCACYQCAKKIYNAKGRCPICRRAASSFYKIYTI